MNPKTRKRTWLITVIALFALLPAFPLLLILAGVALMAAGLSHLALSPVLMAHHFYYSLPARIFGPSLFPAQEFGLLPTPAGYVVAAIFYAFIAVVLSFPVCWLLRLRGEQRDAA